jgi:hypothetical protein
MKGEIFMETETSAESSVQEGEHTKIQSAIPVTAPVEKKTWGIRGHLVVLLLNFIITAGSIFAYHRYFPQRIVAMDLRGYLQKQQAQFVVGKLTDEQFKANMDRFEAKLNSLPPNCIVLMADSALRGVSVIEP